jgi:hypothetical protein
VKQHAPHAVRIGLESGQLSSWLFHDLSNKIIQKGLALRRDWSGTDASFGR